MGYTADLIPTMTGYTAPSGVASADSEYNFAYPPWWAFDHANGTIANNWVSAITGFPHWLRYEFPTSHVVTQYTVTCRSDAAACPSAWTFEGSNDGINWDVLDTKSGVTSWSGGEEKVYAIANSTAYTYYQLNISAGSEAAHVAIAQQQMMETEGGGESTADLFLDGVWG